LRRWLAGMAKDDGPEAKRFYRRTVYLERPLDGVHRGFVVVGDKADRETRDGERFRIRRLRPRSQPAQVASGGWGRPLPRIKC
jgi:hypothetical protein